VTFFEVSPVNSLAMGRSPDRTLLPSGNSTYENAFQNGGIVVANKKRGVINEIATLLRFYRN